MEIYTTGGGYFVQDILQFLALYHASNDFDVLMTIGLTAGVICLACSIMLGMNIRVVLRMFAVMALVGSVFIGRTTSVDVHDKTYGTLSYYATVDNVPYGVALLAHYTTGVGYYVTEKVEQLISTPNDLSYQSNGMLFGASLVAQQARWRAVSNILHERLVEFYQNCIVRGINLRYFDMQVIVGATDLVSATASNIPSSLSYYDVGTGTVETCQNGWTSLSADVNAELIKVLQHHAASTFQRNPGPDGAATTTKLSDALTAMQTKIGMSSATATNTVRQAMLINAFDDSIKRYAAISGNDASLSNLTNSIADIQRRSAYSNVGMSAQKWVPYLKIVFETIYYGAFPFAVFMMVTPMAWMVFKGYCGGFIWLASWEPISAVLHGILLEAASGFYREAAVQTSDGQPTDIAMTWANHFGVIATEQEIGATAAYMMMSVPFITLAIFFGARQMNSLATSMLNVGQGTAIEAGRAAATGQVALSTVSMNTMNANQWQTSSNADTGRLNGYFATGGTYTQNRDLSQNFGGGSALPQNVGLSVSADRGIRNEVSARASNARSAAKSVMSETANYLNEGASKFSGLLNSASDSMTNSTTNSRSVSVDDAQSLRKAQSTLQQAAQSAGVDSQVFLKTAFAANAGLSKGVAAASVGGDTGINSQSRESANKTWQAANSRDVQEAISTIERIGTTSNWGDASSSGTSANQGDRWSLDQGRRMTESLSNTLRMANDYTRAESQLNTKGVVSGTQLTVMAKNALLDQFPNNPAAVDRILNARDFSALADQKGVLDEIVGDLVDFYAVNPGVQDNTQGFNAGAHYQPSNAGTVPDTVSPMHDGVMATSSNMAVAHGQQDRDLRRRHQTGQIPADAEHARITEQVNDGASQTVAGETLERTGQIASDTADAARSAPGYVADKMWSGRQSSLKWREQNVDPIVSRAWQGAQSWWNSSSAANASDSPTVQRVGPRSTTTAIRQQYRQSKNMAQSANLTLGDRDAMIRTVLGEAGNQGEAGMAAVAHVIMNRAEDPRYPSSPEAVSLQPWQFSSWNQEPDGSVPNNRFSSNSEAYTRAGQIVDAVVAGQIPDNTGEAVNFYAPELMEQHFHEGKVADPVPKWYDQAQAERGAPATVIGDHIFTGQKRSLENAS